MDKITDRKTCKGTGLLSGTFETPSKDWECGISEIEQERNSLKQKVNVYEILLNRVRPATLDRFFWSKSLENLCNDIEQSLKGEQKE